MPPPPANDRPILGIVTQASEYGFPNPTDSYIAASYVKFVEASGARAVPVWYDGDEAYLERMYQSLNGVLFPGGGQFLDHSLLLRTASFFLNKSMSSPDWWPTFGHCQGFEVLLMAITGLNRSQCMVKAPSWQAENVSLPLQFVAPSSRWFDGLSAVDATVLSSQPGVTMNNHQWSVGPDAFARMQASTPLSHFRVLTTSVSPGGQTFVSTFEGRDRPVYAMQFHAEKPLFEWPQENINHSRAAVQAMSYFSRFVGQEAARNTHRFASPQEEKAALIYNYDPVFSIGFCSFDQVYFFPNASALLPKPR